MIEDDLYNPAKDYSSAQIDIGTVGWASRDEHFEPGSATNGGLTMVFVTLYRGKTPGEPTKTGVAQGYEIVCQMSSLAGARIPPKGTRVYVAIPKGMEELAGAGVIFASVETTHTKRQLADDRVVLDFGDATHVVIRGKSVAIQSSENEFVSVGTPRSGGTSGVTVQAKDGSGGVVQNGVVSWFVASGGDAKSVIQMTPNGVELLQKDSGFMRLKNGEIVALSKGKAAYIAGNTFIGPNPSTGVAALVGLSGPAGQPSLNVFLGGPT
ncbi:hypothetical protein AKJ09_11232 [Labilithrix luteola]|uniref:Uncharacterized protein n=1 Tax=Labilithrix luteola TaxID=1391654 RepID=A0A0K1QFM6_9BACT|nr:hypothetical protein [Labilithrix luteola]AKV04569.1 hypothetical protein AKJ09_11232 [Labilithrix luteola]